MTHIAIIAAACFVVAGCRFTEPQIIQQQPTIWRDQAAFLREMKKGDGLVIGGSYIIDEPLVLQGQTVIFANFIVGTGCFQVSNAAYLGHLFMEESSPLPFKNASDIGVGPCSTNGGMINGLTMADLPYTGAFEP